MWSFENGLLSYDRWSVLRMETDGMVARVGSIGGKYVPFPVDKEGKIILDKKKPQEPKALRTITVDGVTVTLWSDGSLDSPWSVCPKEHEGVKNPGDPDGHKLEFMLGRFLYDGQSIQSVTHVPNLICASAVGERCGAPCHRPK